MGFCSDLGCSLLLAENKTSCRQQRTTPCTDENGQKDDVCICICISWPIPVKIHEKCTSYF